METTVEQCPLCGTELSTVKFRELQAKLRLEEESKSAELAQTERNLRQRIEQQFKLDLEKQKLAAEKKAKEEAQLQINKLASERDEAAKKLKQAQEREAQILATAKAETEKQKLAAEKKAKEEAQLQINKLASERDEAAKKLKQAQEHEVQILATAKAETEKQKVAAEKKAKEEAQQEINKMAAERDQAAKKLKDAQEREAELLKQAKEQSERDRQKQLTEQRQALESEKKLELLRQQSNFNREREAYQKNIQQMEKRLQKKTSNELGDGAEIDVFDALRESFPGDKITRIRKGQPGADILHEVSYKGQQCGTIIVDSKNHQGWKSDFVTKLRQDQVDAKAEHAILTTAAFPAGKKEMCIDSDVIVVAPARVTYIVQILRNAMITMHVRGLSLKERSTKMTRLYKLITSESYSHKFAEAGRLAKEILELDVKEKKEHDNTWKKRGSLATQVGNVLREVETEVAAVIESAEEDGEMPAFPVQRVASNSGIMATEDRTIWNKR